MSWFLRQAQGRPEAEVVREHARYLRAAGVDRALDALAGPFGLRRFLVAFAARPAGGGRYQVVLTDVVAMPLAAGGGPPPADPTGEREPELARALGRLHTNMAMGPAWSRGVLGYVRDAKGRTQILPLFDEDSDAAQLDGLPVPPGPGHPLEHAQWGRLMATWEHRMQAIQARTARVRPDWDLWTVEGDRLVLCYDPVPGQPDRWQQERRARCHPLGTFSPSKARFQWQTDRRPGGVGLFEGPDLVADWAAAHEVALMSAAGLDATWLFAGEFGEDGELLYAAVFEAG